MTEPDRAAPTVVLIHGAFADAGSWAAVVERLLAAGVQVQALAIAMRGLASVV
jgi:alpha-beta hydrolase superfamily lysophospholipase